MSTLLLKLSAPLQSWGADSRFTRRTTRHEPTKSAVLGLIAAAQGRRRTDDLEDLLALRFGVRIDQPGVVLRDFQTAHKSKTEAMPLSDRFYLSDAVFVAGLEAERALLQGIEEALLHPVFPLFLGRRACAPSGKLVLGVVDEGLVEALRRHPWEASLWYRRQATPEQRRLELIRDRLASDGNDVTRESVQDLPRSFSQERRVHDWREVVHDHPVVIEQPMPSARATKDAPAWSHQPMDVFEVV